MAARGSLIPPTLPSYSNLTPSSRKQSQFRQVKLNDWSNANLYLHFFFWKNLRTCSLCCPREVLSMFKMFHCIGPQIFGASILNYVVYVK